LHPTEEVRAIAASIGTTGDVSALFLQQLMAIPPGTALYDVFAVTSPSFHHPKGTPHASGELLRVGQLISRSQFIRSTEEGSLRFWHQRKEEDYELRPDWRAAHGEKHKYTFGAEYFGKMIQDGKWRAASTARST
ncbi:MAG: hypothetical protein SGPRY_007553, partial [Prymnesium sp.]